MQKLGSSLKQPIDVSNQNETVQKINTDQYYIYKDNDFWVTGSFKVKYTPQVLKENLEGFEMFPWKEQAEKECAKRNFEKAVKEDWANNQVPWVKTHKFTYRDFYLRKIDA